MLLQNSRRILAVLLAASSLAIGQELNPPEKRMPAIHMRGQQLTVIYNAVAAISGIKIVWDPAWTTRQTASKTVDVMPIPEGMGTLQALDYVATLTQTFWKATTPTTIFVTNDKTHLPSQ